MNSAAHRLSPGFSAPRTLARTRLAASDAVVHRVFASAAWLARPVAALDEKLRPHRTARFREQIARVHRGRSDGSAELAAIWFARIAREGLRLLLIMGFADAVLRRVHLIANQTATERSCVYAIYHTPWGRVLALWLARQPRGTVFSAGRWMERAREAHLPCTWRGLRELVERLKEGGSAAVTADHFGSAGIHAVSVPLLGRAIEVSTGAARIAAAAGVPIAPVMTRYRKGRLEITIGAPINVDATSVADATRVITAAFDAELRRDPSGWEQAHRFLSAIPAAA